MDHNLTKTRKHIRLYFQEHLPQYTLLEIRRKSSHPEDSHLYMAFAKRDDGTYTVWTTWKKKHKA